MSRRQPLLLLPGLLCDSSVFEPQVAALSDICDITIPDFRGFDSIAAMAAHVLTIAPPRFAMAGFSMGGRVALEIMATALERVERLAIFDTGARAAPPGDREKRQVLVDLAYAKGMRALAEVWLPGMLHPARRTDSTFMEPLIQMVCRSTPDIHAGQIRALVNRRDLRFVLPTIACPAYILCGRQDEFSPLAVHEEMLADMPGARFVIIEDSGHFIPVEAPAQFNAALREWLTWDGRTA